MSVYFYDKAIVDRIRTIINDPEVNIITNEKMFTKSKDSNDDPTMPAVSLYRSGYSLSTLNRNIVMYRKGRFSKDSETSKLYFTQALPITINYQVDVWTRTREQNDEFVRELLWYFTLFPEHRIQLEYEQYKKDIGFHVFLGEQIVDNSEINEFENRGQYYRSTFEIVVDEAQIFMVKTTDYNKIKVTLKSYDAEGVEFDSEEIYNYSQEP